MKSFNLPPLANVVFLHKNKPEQLKQMSIPRVDENDRKVGQYES